MARLALVFVCVAGIAASAFGGVWPAPAAAENHGLELVMFERHGCPWCARWNEEIGGVYAKTEEGAQAPLRRVDIHDQDESEVLLREAGPLHAHLRARPWRARDRPHRRLSGRAVLLADADRPTAGEKTGNDRGDGAMKRTRKLIANRVSGGLDPGRRRRASAQDEGLVETKAMSLDTAMALAQGALENCREGGYQIAVAVVDRSGLTQVVLRDRYAGPHTLDTATRKAWTGGFVPHRHAGADRHGRRRAAHGRHSRHVPAPWCWAAACRSMSAGAIIGGVGVSGAPDPELDDGCARAGIDAVQDILDF